MYQLHSNYVVDTKHLCCSYAPNTQKLQNISWNYFFQQINISLQHYYFKPISIKTKYIHSTIPVRSSLFFQTLPIRFSLKWGFRSQ